jgi:sugar lactone lactonase YvrE
MRFKICLVFTTLAFVAGPGWAHPPAAESPLIFALGIDGPEGLAFTRRGELIVGSTTGQIRSYTPQGNFTVLADVGDALAGITVLRDGRILAASLAQSRVWSISSSGTASIFANVPSPNFIVQTRRRKGVRRILCSSSFDGTIVDITNGTPTPVITGLGFPNGMAIGPRSPRHYLYVAETTLNRISRFLMNKNGTFGPLEVYKEGLTFPDGLVFDRKGNLLVAGGGTIKIIDGNSGSIMTLPEHPAFNGPSNLAFGRGPGFGYRRDVFVANFGPALGDGTTISTFHYNHHRARLIR